MLKFSPHSLITRILAIGLLTAGGVLQANSPAIADYVPPGGEPPGGNTSTSGMSLR